MPCADLVALLFESTSERGDATAFVALDTGPELIADTLQDWCRAANINTSYCDPGSPWQNGRSESFNSTLRDELLTLKSLLYVGDSIHAGSAPQEPRQLPTTQCSWLHDAG
ncbi:MAG: integrase core domain-containing protein [Actinomycetota bacterium]